MKCVSCDSVSINGMLCHEQGCSDSHIDLSTGNAYSRECDWCGQKFMPDNEDHWRQYCDDSCYESDNL